MISVVLLVIASFGSVTATSGSQPQDQQVELNRIRTLPKSISVYSTTAEIHGRWSRVAGKDSSFVKTINTAHVLCGKPEKVCTESLAWVSIATAESTPMLEVETLEYRVEEWSATLIRATMTEPTGITFEIRIDPVHNVAERIVRVSNASAGKALSIRPEDSWRWILQ